MQWMGNFPQQLSPTTWGGETGDVDPGPWSSIELYKVTVGQMWQRAGNELPANLGFETLTLSTTLNLTDHLRLHSTVRGGIRTHTNIRGPEHPDES